jgi:hypothetical protein
VDCPFSPSPRAVGIIAASKKHLNRLDVMVPFIHNLWQSFAFSKQDVEPYDDKISRRSFPGDHAIKSRELPGKWVHPGGCNWKAALKHALSLLKKGPANRENVPVLKCFVLCGFDWR